MFGGEEWGVYELGSRGIQIQTSSKMLHFFLELLI